MPEGLRQGKGPELQKDLFFPNDAEEHRVNYIQRGQSPAPGRTSDRFRTPDRARTPVRHKTPERESTPDKGKAPMAQASLASPSNCQMLSCLHLHLGGRPPPLRAASTRDPKTNSISRGRNPKPRAISDPSRIQSVRKGKTVSFANANLHDDGVLVAANPEVSRSIHNWAHTEEFYVAKDWFGMNDLDLQSPTNPSELVMFFCFCPSLICLFFLCFLYS